MTIFPAGPLQRGRSSATISVAQIQDHGVGWISYKEEGPVKQFLQTAVSVLARGRQTLQRLCKSYLWKYISWWHLGQFEASRLHRPQILMSRFSLCPNKWLFKHTTALPRSMTTTTYNKVQHTIELHRQVWANYVFTSALWTNEMNGDILTQQQQLLDMWLCQNNTQVL